MKRLISMLTSAVFLLTLLTPLLLTPFALAEEYVKHDVAVNAATANGIALTSEDFVTVTFDTVGGEMLDGNTVITVPRNVSLVEYLPMNPLRSASTFSHWAFANGTRFNPANGLNQDTLLIANWTHSVIFNANHARVSLNQGNNPNNATHFLPRTIPSGQTVSETSLMTWPNIPNQPTGMRFLGWFDSSVVGTGTEFDGDSVIDRDLVLFAQWEYVYHRVFLEAGDGTLNWPTNYVYFAHNSNVGLSTRDHGLAFPANPTRAGFNFGGWVDVAGVGRGGFFTTGTSPTAANRVVESWSLYASWFIRAQLSHNRPHGSNLDTGILWVTVPERDLLPDGSGVVLNVPERASTAYWTFLGHWNMPIPANTPLGFEPEGAFRLDVGTNIRENDRFYARWEGENPRPVYRTLVFDLMGGEWSVGLSDNITYIARASRSSVNSVIPHAEQFPTKEGYYFAGWFIGEERFYNLNQVPSWDTEVIEARWTRDVVRVYAELQGGEILTGIPKYAYFPRGITGLELQQLMNLYMPNSIVSPRGPDEMEFWAMLNSLRGHHELAGATHRFWSLCPMGSTHSWIGGLVGVANNRALTEDTVLYSIRTVEIRHNSNQRFFEPAANEGVVVRNVIINSIPHMSTQAQSRIASMLPAAPTLSGHRFVGWNTAQNGSGEWFDRYTVVTQPKTVFGIFSYLVEFNSGFAPEDSVVERTRVFDTWGTHSLMTHPDGVPPTPIWCGQTFLHWNTVRDGSGVTYMPETIMYIPRVLYAVWYAGVAFNDNFSSQASLRIGTIIGRDISVLFPPDPIRSNWHFVEWNANADGSGVVFTPLTVVLQGVEVFAQWRATVTFDFNDGYTADETRSVLENHKVSEHGGMPVVPERKGYVFNGWVFKDGTPFSENTRMTFGDVRVVASWEAVVDDCDIENERPCDYETGDDCIDDDIPYRDIVVDICVDRSVSVNLPDDEFSYGDGPNRTIVITIPDFTDTCIIVVFVPDGWTYDYTLEDGVATVVATPPRAPDSGGNVVGGNVVAPTPPPEAVVEDNVSVFSGKHRAFLIGMPDGTINTHGSLTRAQATTIFFRLLSDEFRATHWSQVNPFIDVNDDAWFNNAVSTLYNAGILAEETLFRPNEAITRAEFAALAARLFDWEAHNIMPFANVDGCWAESYTSFLAVSGWMRGDVDGDFRANSNITRAEAAAIVTRMLDRVIASAESLLPGRIHWSDKTNANAWYYLYLQEASHTTAFVRLEDGTIVWTEILPHLDWSKLERPDSRPWSR